jgi:hypothetical protein
VIILERTDNTILNKATSEISVWIQIASESYKPLNAYWGMHAFIIPFFISV